MASGETKTRMGNMPSGTRLIKSRDQMEIEGSALARIDESRALREHSRMKREADAGLAELRDRIVREGIDPRMISTGEPIGYTEGAPRALTEREEAISRRVGEQVSMGRQVCDFCASPRPRWWYPCREYTIIRDGNAPDIGSRGNWAACDICRTLIDHDHREALVMRVALRVAVRYGVALALMTPEIREAQQGFFDHRTGEPVPL